MANNNEIETASVTVPESVYLTSDSRRHLRQQTGPPSYGALVIMGGPRSPWPGPALPGLHPRREGRCDVPLSSVFSGPCGWGLAGGQASRMPTASCVWRGTSQSGLAHRALTTAEKLPQWPVWKLVLPSCVLRPLSWCHVVCGCMAPTACGVVGLTALLSAKMTPRQTHGASGH